MASPFRGTFSDRQRAILLEPIKPHRVSKDGKGFSHLEAFEVKAHLTRVFGFEGWDTRIDSLSLLFEQDTVDRGPDGATLIAPAPKWTVGYLCQLTLSVYGDGLVAKSVSDASTGDATNQRSRADAHDLAVKSAVSGALKRCATSLGDQYGLSLYAKGSMEALVKRVIPYEEKSDEA